MLIYTPLLLFVTSVLIEAILFFQQFEFLQKLSLMYIFICILLLLCSTLSNCVRILQFLVYTKKI